MSENSTYYNDTFQLLKASEKNPEFPRTMLICFGLWKNEVKGDGKYEGIANLGQLHSSTYEDTFQLHCH